MSKRIDLSAEMQSLSDILAQYAPDKWEYICIDYSSDDDSLDIDVWSILSGKNIPVDIDDKDIDLLEEQFEAIKKKTVEKWIKASFKLTSKGECEIDFSY